MKNEILISLIIASLSLIMASTSFAARATQGLHQSGATMRAAADAISTPTQRTTRSSSRANMPASTPEPPAPIIRTSEPVTSYDVQQQLRETGQPRISNAPAQQIAIANKKRLKSSAARPQTATATATSTATSTVTIPSQNQRGSVASRIGQRNRRSPAQTTSSPGSTTGASTTTSSAPPPPVVFGPSPTAGVPATTGSVAPPPPPPPSVPLIRQ